jgi:hypothetical protein
MQRLPLLVLPDLGGVIAIVEKDFLRAPVLLFTWEESPSLQDQDTLARMREAVGDCSSTGSGADDDEVVLGAHDGEL